MLSASKLLEGSLSIYSLPVVQRIVKYLTCSLRHVQTNYSLLSNQKLLLSGKAVGAHIGSFSVVCSVASLALRGGC